MITVVCPRHLPEADADAKLGGRATSADYSRLFRENVKVTTWDGRLVAVLLKQ